MPTTVDQAPWAVEKGAVQKESNAGWGTGGAGPILAEGELEKIGRGSPIAGSNALESGLRVMPPRISFLPFLAEFFYLILR